MSKNKANKPPISISNNTFTGVHWDAQAVGAVNNVALGLRTNAEALLKLAELFHAQDIRIECLLKVQGPQTV